ncbi:MAG: glycoside hydrolase family 15 protein [Myxococcota bacterium]
MSRNSTLERPCIEASDYKPIENYGVVGNLRTVALVGMDGSVDFMCFPHFDSPTVFGALLDRRKGGRFCITPAIDGVKQRQLYYPNTNILLTRFLCSSGVAEISDFMPISCSNQHDALVRQVKVVRGEVPLNLVCAPKFDYGRCKHEVHRREGEIIFVSQGGYKLAFRLRIPVPCDIRDGSVTSQFRLHTGETITFVFEEAVRGEPAHFVAHGYGEQTFHESSQFWQNWVSRSAYRGRWRGVVSRSALTLKLLTSSAYGAIIAAPTFGLPEQIGGERNWDYRYTWIRDAAFTLYALIKLGFTDEATAFMKWLEARCYESNSDGSIQVMYGIDGRHRLDEEVLAHLEGYRGSAPVRIGNAAYDQLQLDIYGELMDSVYLYDTYGQPISGELWNNLTRMMQWVCQNWRKKDEGIWETRGGQKEFLYSRLMCWVALDRAIRLAIQRSFPCPLTQWRETRDVIYYDIHRHFWSKDKKAFIQAKGLDVLDASTLIMPMVKFISPQDFKWLSTLNAIEQELVSDSLVYRYNASAAPDGLEGQEGTFCMCSFWYVEVLARSGHLQKARFFFEKMLSYANHLGLYAEELGPNGEHLGNIPQGFTHLGLVSAALHLDKLLDHQSMQRGSKTFSIGSLGQ